MARAKIQKTSQSRVWLIENRAGPANAPSYQSLARAGTFSWPQGDKRLIRGPSEEQYERFEVLEQISGVQGSPLLNLHNMLTREASELLSLIHNGCPFDVQLHIGACKSPLDFNGGWEKILVLEGGTGTEYGTGDLGALDLSDESEVLENVPVSGLDFFEIMPIIGQEVASTTVYQEVVAVNICDAKTCGSCGLPSDGCQVGFAVALAAGGSPGLAAQVVYTEDGWANHGDTVISSLPANLNPSDADCVGTRYVVISEDDEALHYALIADILDGAETWVKMATGFVAGHGPTAIFSINAVFTWIAGEDGYIYFSSDVTSSVTAQTSGTVTTENLNDIHGIDTKHLVSVGDNNAVLVTDNGGATWSSVTGPTVGVNLNTVWMKSEDEWFVGTAGGELWYTRDGGVSWAEKDFPGSGAGSVDKLAFANNTVGYMSHQTATPAGRILRSINGGYDWYVLPEADGLSLPVSDYLNDIAACPDDPNLVWGGGLAGNGTDGIIIKVA